MSPSVSAVDFCEICENFEAVLVYDKSLGMTICRDCKKESTPPKIRKKKRHREDGED